MLQVPEVQFLHICYAINTCTLLHQIRVIRQESFVYYPSSEVFGLEIWVGEAYKDLFKLVSSEEIRQMAHRIVSHHGNIMPLIFVESSRLDLVSHEIYHFVADFDPEGVFVWEIFAELEKKPTVTAADVHEIDVELLGFAAL